MSWLLYARQQRGYVEKQIGSGSASSYFYSLRWRAKVLKKKERKSVTERFHPSHPSALSKAPSFGLKLWERGRTKKTNKQKALSAQVRFCFVFNRGIMFCCKLAGGIRVDVIFVQSVSIHESEVRIACAESRRYAWFVTGSPVARHGDGQVKKKFCHSVFSPPETKESLMFESVRPCQFCHEVSE